jgi:hypothetical protein
MKWSRTIVHDLLVNGMLAHDEDREAKASRIVDELGDHALTLSHARHLSADRCRRLGLVIEQLEEDEKLQDAVLSVHHCCTHTLSQTHAVKIIENHRGIAFVNQLQQVVLKPN